MILETSIAIIACKFPSLGFFPLVAELPYCRCFISA